jgi:hypothetical protein
MAGMYTLTALRGARAEWSRLMPFASDAHVIAAARRIAETQIRKSRAPHSLMVGRTWDEGQVAWPGAWDCDVEAGLSWEAEDTASDSHAGS